MSGDASNSTQNLPGNPAGNPPGNPSDSPNRSRATLRTFIAIDLPTLILSALATTQERLQDYLRAHERALRWSPMKNLHLTLRFLGDTTHHQRAEVEARLQEVTAHVMPMRLSVDASGRGLGGFPTLRHPRVLWSGVGGDLEALKHLQAQVEAVAQAVGFAPEANSYSPHLTLARAAREVDRRVLQEVGQAISDYAQQPRDGQLLSFEVNRLIFYQSELGTGGSRYTVLAEFPFLRD